MLKGKEMYWELCKTPNGDYCLWLCDYDLIKDKTIIINIDSSEAEHLIETTGCKVNELPF